MNKQSLYRLCVMLVPVVSLFVAAALLLFEVHHFKQLSLELASTETQISQLDTLIKRLEAQPPLSTTPALAQSQVEQPEFLTMMRTFADSTHVQLTRWSNAGPMPRAAAGSDPGKTPLPTDVTAVKSSVEAAGRYNDLRHFLYSIQNAPRLFTLSSLVWTRNDKWPATFLKFDLTRYVMPPGRAPLRAPMPVKLPPASAEAALPRQDPLDASPARGYSFTSTDYLMPGLDKTPGTEGK